MYQCVFCAKRINKGALDVSSLILILKWDRPRDVQRTQQFFCHAECFRSRIHESVTRYLFIFDEDSDEDLPALEGGKGEG